MVETRQIRVNKKTAEKLNNYLKAVNDNKGKNEKTITSAVIVSPLIEKFLKGKVLDNTKIKLKEPYYFNWLELVENGVVECTTEKPVNLDNVMILKYVPNDLDKWTGETYAYEKPKATDKYIKHRGITPNSYFDEETLKVTFFNYEDVHNYLIFEYLAPVEAGTEAKLTISILKPSNTNSYFDVMEYKEHILKIENIKDEFYNSASRFCEVANRIKCLDDVEDLAEIDVPVETLEEKKLSLMADYGFILKQWKYINYDLFLPYNTYFKLGILLYLFENATTDEVETLEKILDVTKDELANLVNGFTLFEDEIKLMLFLGFVEDEKGVVNSNPLNIDGIVKDYVNNSTVSEILKKYFLNDVAT